MKSEILYKTWLAEWLEQKKLYVKESTYANYTMAVINHIIPKLGDLTLSELDERKLQKTTLTMLSSGRIDGKGGLAEKTVRDIMVIIKLSLHAAMKEGLIPSRQSEIFFPKNNKIKKIRLFSKEDQARLTQVVYLNICEKNAGILFCLHTGIRIGELCALQWHDIDLEKRIVSIDKTMQRIFTKSIEGGGISKLIITSPKTVSSIRTIPLSSAIMQVLQKIKSPNPNAYLLTGNENFIEPRTYRSHYDRLLHNNNIDHINFHGLRHTFATRLIEAGADYKTVSELLGHSSINMTMNLYVHPQMDTKRKAVELVNGFLL